MKITLVTLIIRLLYWYWLRFSLSSHYSRDFSATQESIYTIFPHFTNLRNIWHLFYSIFWSPIIQNRLLEPYQPNFFCFDFYLYLEFPLSSSFLVLLVYCDGVRFVRRHCHFCKFVWFGVGAYVGAHFIYIHEEFKSFNKEITKIDEFNKIYNT